MKRITIQYPHPIRAVFTLTLIALALALGPERAAAQGATILYVDQDATPAGGSEQGLSWENPFTNLQDALAAADQGEQTGNEVEVWVANGTYYPDVSGSGDADQREDTFTITSFPVYGGFRGATGPDAPSGGETSLGDRPANAHRPGIARTLLSGEIQQDSDPTNNTYSVVTVTSGEGILDGFVVTGGYDHRGVDPGGPYGTGAGVAITGDGATVRNSIFRDNDAKYWGHGICGFDAGYTLVNVLLTDHASPAGGVSINNPITVTLKNTTIADNSATPLHLEQAGGEPASLVVENSIIHNNGHEISISGSGTGTLTQSQYYAPGSGFDGCDSADVTCTDMVTGPMNFRSDPIDYSLTSGSVALNGGDESFLPADASDLDGDGNTAEAIPVDGAFRPRIQNGTVGIGAYEGDEKVLPVELVAFTAQRDGRRAVLQWETASETNNAGFHVQRRTAGGTWRALENGFVEGAGTTSEPQAYHFDTGPLDYSRHAFRLRQVDTDGTETLSAAVEVTITPQAAGLSTPYPNPARGTATLELVVSRRQDVRVEAFDLLGRRVATLHEGEVAPGEPRLVRLSGTRLASGVYLVRAIGEDFTATQKVTLVE